MLESLDQHKEAIAATQVTLASCSDATMLPLWQALAVKQEDATVRAETCYQRFLNGDFEDADEAKNAISEALKTKGEVRVGEVSERKKPFNSNYPNLNEFK